MVGEDGEALVGDAGGEQLVDVRGERELELAVLGEDRLPAAQVGRRVEELAQALAAVAHQVPAPRGVGRDELGHVARVDALEDREQPGLEHVRGGVRLEPEVAVGGRDAQHGRPPAHVRLLDLAGRLEPVLGQARVDPGGRLGEPAGLHPGEAGIGGDCVGQAARLARAAPRTPGRTRGHRHVRQVPRYVAFHGKCEHHTVGSGFRGRPAHRPAAGGRAAVRVGGRAARAQGRAVRALRLHHRRVGAARPGDAAGARPGEAARRAGQASRDRGGARTCARGWAVAPRRAASMRSRAASTSEARISAPSPEPSSGSTACSGWGIRPITLPCSLRTPATSAIAPFGFSPAS